MNPKELRELVDGRVADKKVRKRDAELFHEFISEYSVLENLRDRTIQKWIFGFSGLCQLLYEHVDKTTDQLQDADAITFIRAIQSSDWAEETRSTRCKQWTGYMKWMHRRHGPVSPKCHELFVDRDTKYNYKVNANLVKRKDTPTREETLRIISAETYDGLKTFYAVLADGGFSFTEAASLQFKDIEANPSGRGYIAHVREGKNGARIRPVALVEFSVGYIDKRLRSHPTKAPDAKFFTMPNGKPLQNATVNQRLKLLVKGLGIKKHITAHCFRHQRSTEMSNYLNEFELSRQFGWVQGSKQPQRYIRASGIDVTRKLNIALGYQKEDSAEKSTQGKTCLQCCQLNAADAVTCDVCTSPLDPVAYRRIHVGVEEQEKLVERLIKEKWKEQWETFREIVKTEEQTHDQ